MPHYLLYDGECSLCVRFQQQVRRRDRHGRIEPVLFGDPRIASIAPTLSREQLERSFHLVSPDGTVVSGHRAIPELLALLPGGRPFAWLLRHVPFSERLSQKTYEWLATHRRRA